MKIGIIGLGFVGLSLTSVLAAKGHDVVGIDSDIKKCNNIINGKLPFYEPDLDKNLKIGFGKKLKISNDILLLKNHDFIFITVGTPQKNDLPLGMPELLFFPGRIFTSNSPKARQGPPRV